MNTSTETNIKAQHHDYADSVVAASLVIATAAIPNTKTNNNDKLEVNLANHIEAFCDCV